MDVVAEKVVNEGHALIYTDDLVLICETMEEASLEKCALE